MQRSDEGESGMFVRWQPIELHREQPQGDNKVRVVASSDNPVDWGYFREILLHSPDNVDTRAAATCLFNHNRNMPIGGIESCTVDGKTMTATLDIDPQARAESGTSILEGIRKGWIRGVSIGYQYDMDRDADITQGEDKTTVTVRKWRLREISITPTQADVTAQVTRTQETIKTRSAKSATAHTEGKATMFTEEQKAQFRTMARAAGLSDAEIEQILKRDGITFEGAMSASASVVAQRAAAAEQSGKIEAARNAETARCQKIMEQARSLDLDPTPYLKLDDQAARAQMATDLAEKKRAAGRETISAARRLSASAKSRSTRSAKRHRLRCRLANRL